MANAVKLWAENECIHTVHRNDDAQYTMGGAVLNTTVKEKGNQILGLIRRNIVYKEK